ncbi:MAG: TonB-dependent receptor [Sphingomonas sp.]|uniref:TonB-dependent receptor domain-containing protein n=1 Tax=Sphingomonas sp. TaxID=28214 RepID=UPI0025CF6C29|nr:TonB-dependent receptor [Sphingomonas sp.]MBY0283039.1 TonB-dependent receptor [Sphingomonas sp.]
MSRPFELASLLLISTALVAPSVARAQTAPPPAPSTPVPAPTPVDQAAPSDPAAQADPAATEAPQEAQPEVSIPGGAEVVVTARRGSSNIAKTSTQSLSLLSSADIARTGEGDIAGALARVTGLSVVGNGFVYVRGLGDRYSLALLNGSPLPSPEPLRRVVPLDIFPTSIIGSTLVQKSYSVNFPGEYGGGVINLTTKTAPKEAFLKINSSIGADSVTTGQLGYTYFGSSSDWTGFDNGARDVPPALANFLASGQRISQGTVNTQAIASQLVTGSNAIVQRNQALPPNWSLSLEAGKSWDIGDNTLGIIATFGYSNKWRTRSTTQQTAASLDLSLRELDFQRVITDNRLVVDGLIGATYDFGPNKIRWNTLYIRDTIKQARLGVGTRTTTSQTATLQQQDTAWYERQLIDTQLVGEFRLTDQLRLDARAAYANSRREAPNELSFEYFRSNSAADPFGAVFVNQLNNGLRGTASTSFSNLRETLYSGGFDLSYKFTPEITATLGYAYQDTFRRTERREFLFTAGGNFPTGVGVFRPDLLLQPAVIRAFGVNLIDTNEGNPVFGASLVVHAGYARLQWDINDRLSLDTGVRFESAQQRVNAIQVFTTPSVSLARTGLSRDYFLPAVTLTFKLNPEMQFRISGAQTIARPQFRELIFQNYFDPDDNRQYRGNPFLVDTQLYNAEARWEWYFARDQRLTVAGFYKRIDNPIETFASFSDNTVTTSFANAPTATLYGAEIETQKYFRLANIFGGGKFWASRRAVVIANYTFSQSSIVVGPNDPASVFGLSGITRANQLFRNGVPLTGQSDHLANLELGFEDQDRLSQQTFLLNYASRRATIRGGSGQPDIYEYPGFRLDFVARQGVKLGGINTEMKFEVRNITGTRFQEFQENGPNRIFYNRYDLGTTATFGLSVNF